MSENIGCDRIEIRGLNLYIDGDDFARDIINSCKIPKRSTITMNKNVDDKINVVVGCIFNLREQEKNETAIDLSDTFFQSFTPLMNILLESSNYYQVSHMWKYIILKINAIENASGIEFGKGVHKGTAFYFLGLTNFMMGDLGGAYLCFAEAAKEDEVLPESVLSRYTKELPPVVKILLLDLGRDNFAYDFVKKTRETINKWERENPEISRSTSIFTSMETAIEKGVMPRESAIHVCYAFINAILINAWSEELIRPTSLNINQLGESILRFARTLEDFIKSTLDSSNNGLFKYCHGTWFTSENWNNVPNYGDIGIEALMNDYDEWNFSKDGKNLLFTIKIRNVLAHRIPNDKTLYNNYIKMILIIACSFGFICDKISE